MNTMFYVVCIVAIVLAANTVQQYLKLRHRKENRNTLADETQAQLDALEERPAHPSGAAPGHVEDRLRRLAADHLFLDGKTAAAFQRAVARRVHQALADQLGSWRTGRRRPLASGSPSSILRYSSCLTWPWSSPMITWML